MLAVRSLVRSGPGPFNAVSRVALRHLITGNTKIDTIPLTRPPQAGAGAGFGGSGSIQPCTTIDSNTTNDSTGYLSCARTDLPNSGAHGSTIEAVNNVLKCLALSGPNDVRIVGHGNIGVIVTGTGQSTSDVNKCLSGGNESVWSPVLKRLSVSGNCTHLMLWGCHVGAGDNGSAFLYDVARVVGCPVSGPTGLVFSCGGMRLENGAVWQTATPNKKPAPIAAPVSKTTKAKKLNIVNLSDPYQLGEVDSVKYFDARMPATPLLAVSASRAQDIVSTVDFENPQDLGYPGAVQTGYLKLSVGGDVLEFFVLNNGFLLQDKKNLRITYATTTAFRDILANAWQ